MLVLVLLAGCTTTPSNYFSKKQECNKYQGQIRELLKDRTVKSENSTFKLIKIFYSPKLNSCAYLSLEDSSRDGRFFEKYDLNDALTGEIIISSGVWTLEDDTYLERKDNFFSDLEKYE